MNKLLGLAVGTLLLGGGTYFGSPYLAANSLKTAAISGDADALEAGVDFPAVREGLKSQLSVAMTQKLNSDPDMNGNPFAGLGMMMLPTIVDKAVDAYITPDGVAAMVRGSRPNGAKPDAAAGNSDMRYDQEWVSADRFRVRMTNISTQEAGPTLVFERRGLIAWKLVKIDIAESLLKN